MEFNSSDYTIEQKTQCNCGYNFTLQDINGLQRINEHGFYGNNVKHISVVKCPNCREHRVLLLKQAGQTWQIVAVGFVKKLSDLTQNNSNEIDKEKIKTNELICPYCKKVCKSELGLKSHMKIHQN